MLLNSNDVIPRQRPRSTSSSKRNCLLDSCLTISYPTMIITLSISLFMIQLHYFQLACGHFSYESEVRSHQQQNKKRENSNYNKAHELLPPRTNDIDDKFYHESNGSLMDNLGELRLISLMDEYFKLPIATDSLSGEQAIEPTNKKPMKNRDDASNQINCTTTNKTHLQDLDCDNERNNLNIDQDANLNILEKSKNTNKRRPELPKPYNLSVLMLSHYPPILELRWNFNEFINEPIEISKLDFYYNQNNNNETNTKTTIEEAEAQREAIIRTSEFGDLNNNEHQQTDGIEIPTVNRDSSSFELHIRRQLIKRTLSCFQIMYHVANSRFKILEEYAPDMRNITMEWLLPATEYSLRVIAVYANRYRVASDRVNFLTPSDEKSRRFREGTYRPIHRSPDERRELKIGLDHVRNEELTIVAIAIGFWLATIYWFFNKWGKIRMLEPYQPAYREASPTPSTFGTGPLIQGFSSMHNLSAGGGGAGGAGGSHAGDDSDDRPSATSIDHYGPNLATAVASGQASSLMGQNLGFCESSKTGSSGCGTPTGQPNPPTTSAHNASGSIIVDSSCAVGVQERAPFLSSAKSLGSGGGSLMVGSEQIGSSPFCDGGTSSGDMLQMSLPVSAVQARRASRNLLLLGHKRFGTTPESEPVAALESLYRQAALAGDPSNESTINYLFQKKAHALARATNMWSRRPPLPANKALAHFQATARRVGADEVELLTAAAAAAATASSGTGVGLRCRSTRRPSSQAVVQQASLASEPSRPSSTLGRIVNRSTTNTSASSHHHRGPAEYQALRAALLRAGTTASDQSSSGENASTRLSALVGGNPRTAAEINLKNAVDRAHRASLVPTASSAFSELAQQVAASKAAAGSFFHVESGHRDRESQPATPARVNSEETSVPPLALGPKDSISAKQHQFEPYNSVFQESVPQRTVSEATSKHPAPHEQPSANRIRRMLFMNRKHQHHHVTTSTSSSTLIRTASSNTNSRYNGISFDFGHLTQAQPTLPLESPALSVGDHNQPEAVTAPITSNYHQANVDPHQTLISASSTSLPNETLGGAQILQSSETQQPDAVHAIATITSSSVGCDSYQQASNSDLSQHRIQIQPPSPTSQVRDEEPEVCKTRDPSRRLVDDVCTAPAVTYDPPSYHQQQQHQHHHHHPDLQTAESLLRMKASNSSSSLSHNNKFQPQICLQEAAMSSNSSLCLTDHSIGDVAPNRVVSPGAAGAENQQPPCADCQANSPTSHHERDDAFAKLAQYQRSIISERASSCSACLTRAERRCLRLSELRRQCTSNTSPGAVDLEGRPASVSTQLIVRPRVSSMFVPLSREQRDSFQMLSTLSQKKSKSAEDVAYLSSLVLQIWTRPDQKNPLLQSATSHQGLEHQQHGQRRQMSHSVQQQRNSTKRRITKSSLIVSLI